MRLINNWKELAEVPESNTHRLEIGDHTGWLISKDAKQSDWGTYLSTHTFYGSRHEYSTELLQNCGFDVQLANGDDLDEIGKNEL